MVSKEDLEASKSRKYCLSLRGAKITEEWRVRKKVFPQKNSLAKGPVFISVAIALLLLVGQTVFASCQGFDPWAGRPMGEFEGAFHISDGEDSLLRMPLFPFPGLKVELLVMYMKSALILLVLASPSG